MLRHRVICDTSAKPQGTTHLLWVRVACSRWGIYLQNLAFHSYATCLQGILASRASKCCLKADQAMQPANCTTGQQLEDRINLWPHACTLPQLPLQLPANAERQSSPAPGPVSARTLTAGRWAAARKCGATVRLEKALCMLAMLDILWVAERSVQLKKAIRMLLSGFKRIVRFSAASETEGSHQQLVEQLRGTQHPLVYSKPQDCHQHHHSKSYDGRKCGVEVLRGCGFRIKVPAGR